LAWLADAADRAGITLTAPPAHRIVSRWWPQAERSDHGPFTRRGVRAVHFYNRGNDGDWIDLAYHSPRDVPARLHRDSLADTSRLLRALVDVPPPAHAGDGFWIPIANRAVPRWWLLAFESLLVVVVIVSLVLSREGLVAAIAHRNLRANTPRGPALLIGIVCYAVAVAAGCGLERAFAHGHPAPWLHAPLRALIGDALIILGLFGLATRAVARIRPWLGGQRYRVFASLVCATIGTALLIAGAAELAWLWLVPAVVIAVVPTRAAVVAVIAAALPIACVLSPPQLREAAWNGFLPLSLPLSLWLGIVAAPTICTLAWWLRNRRRAGPLGTLVLGLGCGLAVGVGLVFAIAHEPTCSAAKFERFHLACERV
ncbi:MAG TPA: M28 family peptidase, partial [Kofleriaceae bacterium]